MSHSGKDNSRKIQASTFQIKVKVDNMVMNCKEGRGTREGASSLVILYYCDRSEGNSGQGASGLRPQLTSPLGSISSDIYSRDKRKHRGEWEGGLNGTVTGARGSWGQGGFRASVHS